MAGAQTLDNMDDPSISDEVVPFQFREKKSEEETHAWLKNWFQWEYERAHPRYVMYRRYINMYKNLDDVAGDGLSRISNRDRGMASRKPKVKDNFIYSYTEQRVSRVSRKKTALTFIPKVQNSQEDINASKACKLLVRSRYEDIDFDGQMIRMDRTTYLLGHSLYEICWDPSLGSPAPSYENLQKKYGKGKVPKLNDNGEPTGEYYDKAITIGDAKGKLWQPYQFFPEPGRSSVNEADYLMTFEWMTKQYVEHKWKKAKGKITGSKYVKWDYANDNLQVPNNEVMIYTFWHKPTEFFPEGCKIVWCDDMILSWDAFPYDYGADGFKLPFEEEKDIEVEGEFWGRPFVINIEQFYKVNNSLLSGMARNHGVLSAPKYAFPEGSVDVKSLNNEFGSVAYRGAIPPQVLQHNYVNRGELDFQKYLQGRAGELSSVFDISRGIVPNGVVAAQAIRYLDEQEAQRANPSVAKRNRRVLNITRHFVKIMAQNYKDSDARAVRLVGENNEYIIKSFKKLSLGSIADVRYENTSSIADTKVGAIADIIDLNASNQKDPVFGRKEIIKLLDLGLDDAFKDQATYAVDTANTILEAILDGEQAPAPAKTDGLVEFYSVFGRFVESLTYKTKLDENIKKAIDDYILGMEMLMWQKSVENPKFAMYLANFEKFPMFFSPPAPPAPPVGAPGMGAPAAPGADTSKMELTQKAAETAIEQEGAANG